MALIIPRKLRALVENYIQKGDRKREMGGFFFGEGKTASSFMPIPNYAENTYNSYSFGNTRSIANHFARMVDGEIIADMHTHPDGTIPSGQDKNYVSGMSWQFHIIIGDKSNNDFEWWAVNRKLESVPVVYSDIELNAYGEMLAHEVGLKNLGQVFLSPKGELLGSDEAKTILVVDEDVMRLLEWEKAEDWRTSWDTSTYRTMAHAQRDTKIPLSRIKKAFIKLGWK